jgi:membrane-bound serine protease (ClpP class)
VAKDLDELLALASGREVEVEGDTVTLALTDARTVERELSFRFRLLSYLANPNLAYVLMMLGIYGLFFELQNPGAIFPGVVGAICLILAFYSLQTFPMNLAGLLLIVLGGILFILEAQVSSYGLLTIGGLAASVLGAIMLFDSPEPALRASLAVILPVTIVTALLFGIAVALSVRAMRSKPTTGREGMLGLVGIAKTELAPSGTIEVRGEIWSARAETPVQPGDEVEVVRIEGLGLIVKKRET